MRPSPKGCPICLLASLLLSMQISASPLSPPQPRFDAYSLPPAPPEQIVEYPVLNPPRADVSVPRETVPAPEPTSLPEPAVPESPEKEDRPDNSQVREKATINEPLQQKPESLEDIPPELYARLNERFSLALEGSSWLFLDVYPGGGIVYDGRTREEQLTRFSFRTTERGTYILQFIQGSSGGGSSDSKRVAVEVLPDEEFMTRLTGTYGDAETQEESALPSEKDADVAMSEDERYQAAVEHLAKDEWEEAFRVLTDAAGFDPAEPSRNTVTAFAAALFMEDFMLALDYANFPASLQRDFIINILNLSRDLPTELRRRLIIASLELLPRFHGMDRLVFALAGDYEETGPERDIEEAVRYYRFLLTEYPLSSYWEEAEERANYLERHFLLVR